MTRVVYLANPNNPTGTLATREEVARLYAGLPKNVLFVIDQAYSEYLSEAEDDGGLELAKTQPNVRSEEHTSELQSLMRISYAVFCLKTHKNIDITKHKRTRYISTRDKATKHR